MKCMYCDHALPNDSEFCQYCGMALTVHEDISEESDDVVDVAELDITDTSKNTPSASEGKSGSAGNFCGMCGRPFYGNAQASMGKGISGTTAALLAVIIVLLCGYAIFLNVQQRDKTLELRQTAATVQSLENELRPYKETVVFTSDFTNRLYHKSYDCEDLDVNAHAFRAHTPEYAEGVSYEPCPKCCGE